MIITFEPEADDTFLDIVRVRLATYTIGLRLRDNEFRDVCVEKNQSGSADGCVLVRTYSAEAGGPVGDPYPVLLVSYEDEEESGTSAVPVATEILIY